MSVLMRQVRRARQRRSLSQGLAQGCCAARQRQRLRVMPVPAESSHAKEKQPPQCQANSHGAPANFSFERGGPTQHVVLEGVEAHQQIRARLKWVSGHGGVLIGPSWASCQVTAVLSIVDAVVGC